jgi:hypothetical protein
MTELTDYIKSKRDTLSASSLKTYTSILKSLYSKVFDDEKINMKKFDETDKIISYLKDLEPNKRKTILSALVVVTNKPAYRDLMMEDIHQYKTEINKQEKTDEQKENWVDGDELNKTFDLYKKESDLLYKKTNLKAGDLQEIQNYIILCLLSGKFIIPRRSMDYVNLKIKGDIDKDKDNYIDKNKFVFNSYKTAKTYGKQEIIIPKPLQTILKKWISINPNDYLLFDTNNNKLTNVKLNQRLNKIFGKKASVNAMRHTYLTDKYKPLMEAQKEMSKDLKEMGSSQAQASTYVKLD